MNIDERTYVAIDYRLTLASGEEIDSSRQGEPFGFITGAGQVIPGLEKELMGRTEGYEAQIVVAPEDGYGPVDEELFQEISKSQFPDDCTIEPGMTFQAQGPHGPVMITVKELNGNDTVTVDLNHPLAGEQLYFDIKVVEVREPNAQELAGLEQQASGCGCGCSGCGPDEPAGCGSGGCGC